MAVLVIADSCDSQADVVVQRLQEKAAEAFRIFTDRLPTLSVEIAVGDSQTALRLRAQGRLIEPHEVSGVYCPVLAASSREPHLTSESRTFVEDEWRSFLTDLHLMTPNAVWVNSPTSSLIANDKMHQLREARALGMIVPETLATNDAEAFRLFANRHSGRLVVKRLSGMRRAPSGKRATRMLFTHRLTPTEVGALAPEAIRSCPCVLQEYVPKSSEFRVYVVGDKVLAAEILSQQDPQTQVDWRRYPLKREHGRLVIDGDRWKCRSASLPSKLEDLCRSLVKRLGLVYSAVDLVQRPDGEFVFLEANFGGGFGSLEQMAGIPVSCTIADILF